MTTAAIIDYPVPEPASKHETRSINRSIDVCAALQYGAERAEAIHRSRAKSSEADVPGFMSLVADGWDAVRTGRVVVSCMRWRWSGGTPHLAWGAVDARSIAHRRRPGSSASRMTSTEILRACDPSQVAEVAWLLTDPALRKALFAYADGGASLMAPTVSGTDEWNLPITTFVEAPWRVPPHTTRRELAVVEMPRGEGLAPAPGCPTTAVAAVPRSFATREDARTGPKWTPPRNDLPFSEHEAVVKLLGMAGQEASRIDSHERDDLSQVALAAVVQAHRRFPYRTWQQFVGYARAAVRNALVSYTRRHNRERHKRLDDEHDGCSWDWPRMSARIELHDDLRNTPNAELLVLHAAGYTDRELAARLGITRHAAIKRRQRAEHKLAATILDPTDTP